MSNKRSVASVAKRAIREDEKARALISDSQPKTSLAAKRVSKKDQAGRTLDSFVNFAQKMGIGADSPLTTASYGYNPITRLRTILEWIHRGSWLGGVAIDLKADDMTRAGAKMMGEVTPERAQRVEELLVSLGVWRSVTDTIKWARLYGGAIGVMMIDGQALHTPLRVESIGRDSFRGLLVLDRWVVDPSLNDLVKEMGPDMGLPKFYRVTSDAPAMPGMKIHYSRVLRLTGIELPYWQRVQENLWGISVLERLYDRMIAFDSATTGAAQLIYKAYIRTYNVKGLREVIAAGGEPLRGLMAYVELIRRFQGMEGITLLDGEDKMEAMQTSAFSGISEALLQFGQQLAGALQIPLVRLFGQSPAGLNSTGESDLRMYYDGIKQQQEQELRVPLTRMYRAAAMSLGFKLPDGFRLQFNPLWQLTDEQKADTAEKITRAVVQAEEAGLISQQTAMKELKQASEVTGVFSNIEDEDIEAAEETLPPAGENALPDVDETGTSSSSTGGDDDDEADGPAGKQAKKKSKKKDDEDDDKKKKKKSKDSRPIRAIAAMKFNFDHDIVIENPQGSIRQGPDWECVMPYDYGYLRKTMAPDGQAVDCMIGPHWDSSQVFVIDQVKLDTKQPDEPKVMFGYKKLEHALSCFLRGYSDGRGWDRIGTIKEMTMDDFNKLKAQWTVAE